MRTSAESPEDAKLQAESIIEDWATENNWYTTINVIDTKGTITICDTSRWDPLTLKDIQQTANETLVFEYTPPTIEQINRVINNTVTNNTDYYLVADYFKHLFKNQHKQSVDIVTEEVNAWCFDEVGLTSYNEDPNLPTYFVAIDIHT